MNRKQVAQTFLTWAASGRIKDAYDTFVGTGFKHHNPYVAGDAASLQQAMQQAANNSPYKELRIQRMLEDGDLVAVHSRLVSANAPAVDHAVVHIVRFEGDRIAELWDIAQQVPAESPNVNGMF